MDMDSTKPKKLETGSYDERSDSKLLPQSTVTKQSLSQIVFPHIRTYILVVSKRNSLFSLLIQYVDSVKVKMFL